MSITVPMYKGEAECKASRNQIKDMEDNGWSRTKPEKESKPKKTSKAKPAKVKQDKPDKPEAAPKAASKKDKSTRRRAPAK